MEGGETTKLPDLGTPKMNQPLFRKRLSSFSFMMLAVPLSSVVLVSLLSTVSLASEHEYSMSMLTGAGFLLGAALFVLFLYVPKKELAVYADRIEYRNLFGHRTIPIEQRFDSVSYASGLTRQRGACWRYQDFRLYWHEDGVAHEFHYYHVPKRKDDDDLFELAQRMSAPIAKRWHEQVLAGASIEIPGSIPKQLVTATELRLIDFQGSETRVAWDRCQMRICNGTCQFIFDGSDEFMYPPNFTLQGKGALASLQLVSRLCRPFKQSAQ